MHSYLKRTANLQISEQSIKKTEHTNFFGEGTRFCFVPNHFVGSPACHMPHSVWFETHNKTDLILFFIVVITSEFLEPHTDDRFNRNIPHLSPHCSRSHIIKLKGDLLTRLRPPGCPKSLPPALWIKATRKTTSRVPQEARDPWPSAFQMVSTS